MTTRRTKPPRGISAEAKKLWKELTDTYDFSPDRLEVLRESCHALTRAQQARIALEEYGHTYEDRFGQPKARPEVAIEHNSRLAFNKLIQSLYLSPEDAGDLWQSV